MTVMQQERFFRKIVIIHKLMERYTFPINPSHFHVSKERKKIVYRARELASLLLELLQKKKKLKTRGLSYHKKIFDKIWRIKEGFQFLMEKTCILLNPKDFLKLNLK
jgi:hypothetical protein